MPLLPNALTLKLIRTIPPPFHRLSKPARKFIHTRDITPSCKNILSDFDLFLLDGKFLLLLLLLLYYYEKKFRDDISGSRENMTRVTKEARKVESTNCIFSRGG